MAYRLKQTNYLTVYRQQCLIMKNVSITSGKFTSNGNYTGYTALGQRIFVHKAQMESTFPKAEDVKHPFFAVITDKDINPFDADGKPQVDAAGQLVVAVRTQAMSVFASKQALLDARVDEVTLDIDIKGAVTAKAKASGLSDAAVAALELAVL